MHHRLLIALISLCVLVGCFTAVDGEVPLEGVVNLQGQSEHAGIEVRFLVDNPPLQVFSTQTDAEGRFIFEQAARRTYELRFSRAGYELPSDSPVMAAFDVNSGGFIVNKGEPVEMIPRTTNGEIEVSLDLQPSWLEGLDVEIRVQLLGIDNDAIGELTARVGVPVTFTNLGPGTYILTPLRPGFAAAQRRVDLGDVLQPREVVSLTVRLEDLGAANLDLAGRTLTDAQLTELPTLRGANLAGVTLESAQGGPANLCGQDLSGAELVGTSMPGANLTGVRLAGANLANANLRGAILHGADLQGANFFGADLEAADISGLAEGCNDGVGLAANLRGADFTSARLEDVVFAEAPFEFPEAPCETPNTGGINLEGVIFAQTNLAGAQMPGVMMQGIDLSSALLRDTQLQGACLNEADLVLANATRANFSGSDMEGAVMLGTILLLADLTRVNLHRANLAGANLSGANLSEADLIDASMLGVIIGDALEIPTDPPPDCIIPGPGEGCTAEDIADVESADCADDNLTPGCTWEAIERCVLASFIDEGDAVGFDHAPLRDEAPECFVTMTALQSANLEGATMPGVNFEHVDLRNAELQTADLDGARFSSDSLVTQVVFDGSSMRGVNMASTDLSQASLDGVDLTNSNLSGANLTAASFYRTTFQNTDLSRAVLKDATFSGASIDNSSFDTACLESARLINLTVEDSTFVGASLRLALLDATSTFDDTDLSDTDLSGARIWSVIRNSSLRGVDMTGVTRGGGNEIPCIETGDPDALLSNVDLSDATIFCADLSLFELFDVNFTRADLTGTLIFIESACFVRGVFNGTICPDGSVADEGAVCAGYDPFMEAPDYITQCEGLEIEPLNCGVP